MPHAGYGARTPRPSHSDMTDAYLTVAAFIRGSLEHQHEETARGLAVTDADETRRVASAALDVATVLLHSHAQRLGLDPIAFLDAFVHLLLETELSDPGDC
jgi:hypothetical protein